MPSMPKLLVLLMLIYVSACSRVPIQTDCGAIGFKRIPYTQNDARLMDQKVISERLRNGLLAHNDKVEENCK